MTKWTWIVAVGCAALSGPVLTGLVGPFWAVAAVLLPTAVAALALRESDRRAAALAGELDEVRRTATARADLVAAVSHDVRTPLAMVKVAADLLLQGTPGEVNERQRRFLTTISDQTDQTIAIAEDLLVQARIEAGVFAARLAEVDLNRVVADAVRGLRPLAEQRDQRITVDLPRLPPVVTADERLITRAIVNLSTNAMRFTANGGMVVLRVISNDDSAVISVTDDGAGMTPRAREKLFRPFVSGSPLADGTGLGLVLTRQIALLHGGRLLVDTSPRRGTTIMLRLPHRRTP
ncbi:HAMP domain-containing sensor histidine kinase [Umezawaea sp.]|uniref:sensor histidine kinase n=1 Tax=Umezawaea sp. TaxID=1955258 RepID=UPI002ED4B984